MVRWTGVVLTWTRFSLCPQMSERLLDVENEAMLKIVELEKQLMQTNKELDQVRVSAVTMETVQSVTMETEYVVHNDAV